MRLFLSLATLGVIATGIVCAFTLVTLFSLDRKLEPTVSGELE